MIAEPFLKWAGGKRALLPELRTHLAEPFGRYFEPFVGAGAVFFDLHEAGRLSAGAHLGDSNERLVNCFAAIRDDVDAVIGALGVFTRAYQSAAGGGIESAEAFYLARRDDLNQGRGASVVRAALLIFANHTCHSGLWRVNRSGAFNVPIARADVLAFIEGRRPSLPKIFDADALCAVSEALAGVTIECVDFAKLVECAAEGDLVYLDPPYFPKSASANFVGYCAEGFTASDQRRLKDLALDLALRGAKVVLSNSDTPATRALYAGDFDLHEVSARRAINCKGDGRGPVGEVILTPKVAPIAFLRAAQEIFGVVSAR